MSEIGKTRTPRLPAQKVVVPPIHRQNRPHGGLQVWCKYCNRNHLHGFGYGHRVAHCPDPDSPYRTTGYILVRDPSPTPPSEEA